MEEQNQVEFQAHESKASQIDKRKQFGITAGVILLVAACFLASYGGNMLANRNRALPQTSSFGTLQNDGNIALSSGEKDLSSLVETVSPSVVSIVTSGDSDRPGYEFQGAGSGVVVSKDGYILTNKHVIEGASKATVVMNDGKSYENVKILGSDPLNDIAFLKIENVSNLKALTIGDSKTVRVGQSVIAIGNALGQYQNSVTTGIISGLGRPVLAATDDSYKNAESLSDLIQTDAAINSGNSGGPLLNAKGQVIGINTAIAEDAQSIGFAIPIGAAKGILKGVIATGKVQRAVVGVQYVSITPEAKLEYKLPVDKGDYVTATSGKAIKFGSPAAKAGIQDKDIITKVNGQVVGPGKSTSTLVGEFQPGETITLTILRAGKTLDIKLKLAAY